MATNEKKLNDIDIFLLLRIIGYVMIGLFVIFNLLALFQIVKVQPIWGLLIIGFLLVVIELLPLGSKFIRLSTESSTSTFVWLSVVLFFGIVVAVGYFMWTNPTHWENYNPDFGGLIGGLLSGIATLIVVLFLLNADRRRDIQKARTSAGILKETLSSIDMQTIRIQNGSKEMILYPLNWLEYYYDITLISEYEYLRTLLTEFNYIERINKKIEENDFENAIQIIKERNNYFLYSIEEWNPFDISLNLINIKFGREELSSWSKNKTNQEKIKEIKRKLHKPVEKYIYDYLAENGNTDLSNIENDLVKWILETMELKQFSAERLVVKALLEICSEFNKNSDLIGFCWNELSIKNSPCND